MESPPEFDPNAPQAKASTVMAILMSFLSDPFSTKDELVYDESNRRQTGIAGMITGAVLMFFGIAMNSGPMMGNIFIEVILLIAVYGAGLIGACAVGAAIGNAEDKAFDKTLMGSGIIYMFSGMGFFAAMLFSNIFAGAGSMGFITMFVLPVLIAGLALASIASVAVWKRLFEAKPLQSTYLAPLLSNAALGIAIFIFLQLFMARIGGGRGMSPFMYNLF